MLEKFAVIALAGALIVPAHVHRDDLILSCGKSLSGYTLTMDTTYTLVDGCTYQGTLHIGKSGITVEGLNDGNPPTITEQATSTSPGCDGVIITGSNDTVQYIDFTGTEASGVDTAADAGIAIGYTDPSGCEGSDLRASTGDTIYDDSFSGALWAGVLLGPMGTSDTINDINVQGPGALDCGSTCTESGAMGVDLQGSSNTVENSTFDNEEAPIPGESKSYDGSAVEVYGESASAPDASDNVIEYNTAKNNNNFSELGKNGTSAATPDGNQFIMNNVTGSPSLPEGGITTRGSVGGLGPVQDTLIEDNTFKNTKTQAYGWAPGDPTLIEVEGNTFTYGTGPNNPVFTNDNDAGGCVLEGGNSNPPPATVDTTGCTGSWT